MIFAGPCLFVDKDDTEEVIATHDALLNMACNDNMDLHFRCKIWGGGTRVDRFYPGIGYEGLNVFRDLLLPTGTEVQTPTHVYYATISLLDYIWIGARNVQNYGLLQSLKAWPTDKKILVKRPANMSMIDMVNTIELIKHLTHNNNIYIVERGIDTVDKMDSWRWAPDLKGALILKNNMNDYFDRYIVDCSHSAGHRQYSGDIYRAFKAIGAKHFMFEAMKAPVRAKTDVMQILSIRELEEILNG